LVVVKYILVWLLGVALALLAIAWHPLAGDATWTSEIQRGELMILALTLSGTAVGYAAIGAGGRTRDVLKLLVIILGLVVALLCGLLYSSFSQGALHPEHSVAWKSYAALGASAILGVASVVLTESEGV
jgi:cytochrome bd-type quinol oxidase subunit 2